MVTAFRIVRITAPIYLIRIRKILMEMALAMPVTLMMTMMGFRISRIAVPTLYQEVLSMPADAQSPRFVRAKGLHQGNRSQAMGTMWYVWIRHQETFSRQA
jgi:hypothetical protein